MGTVKKFQCHACHGIVVTEFDDEYVICGHCETACQVPEGFGPGTVIDDFVVVKLLGEGGMGNVYLAHQFSLDRKVALKILKSDFLKDPKFKDEFIYEARSVACLNHPNIIQAYKVGEEEGVVFFAMEYVEGRNLKDLLKEEGAISEKLVVSIAMEIVSALGYAWDLRKLVHRDIKPENIMIASDGTAKLMDLGLSLRDGDNKDEGDMIAGTPQYISPEQILGLDMDIRGDFYCLGATLYHLVSGKLPFEGSLQEIVRQHLSDKPKSLRKIAPGINDFFAKIIHKMLSKKPENRYETADALLNDFKKDLQLLEDAGNGKKHFKISTHSNFMTSTGTSEFSKRKKRRDPVLAASLAMLAFLILGFFVVKIFLGKKYSQPAVQSINKAKSEKNSGSGSRLAVQGSGDRENPPISGQGLYYRYFTIKDDKVNDLNRQGTLIKRGTVKSININLQEKRNEFYAIIFEGYITVPFSETYKFTGKADDNLKFFIDDKKVLDCSYHEDSGVVTLDKGTYPVRIIYYQYSKSKSLNLKVESISVNKGDIPPAWFTLSSSRSDLTIENTELGFNYELYNGITSFGESKRCLPDTEGTGGELSAIFKGLNDKFVVAYNGMIKVPEPGEYKFYLSDGQRAQLFINGMLVEDTLHGKISGPGIMLSSAVNRFELFYSNTNQAASLKLEVVGPGISRQEVPSGWFYKEADKNYLQRKKEEKKKTLFSGKAGTLTYRYYNGVNKVLTDLLNSKPDSEKDTDAIDAGRIKDKTDYGLYYYADIKIPVDDEYTFTLEADDAALLQINGIQITGEGKAALGRGLNTFELLYRQGEGSRSLAVYISSPKIEKVKVPLSWFRKRDKCPADEVEASPETVPAAVASAANNSLSLGDDSVEQGLSFDMYKSATTINSLKEMLNSEQVIKEKNVGNINFKKNGRDKYETNFGLVYKGYLKIDEPGEIQFCLCSNDGSRLYINDNLVIDDDGLHTAKDKFGEVSLKAGYHSFRLEYFQSEMTYELEFKYRNEKGKLTDVPASMFFRKK